MNSSCRRDPNEVAIVDACVKIRLLQKDGGRLTGCSRSHFCDLIAVISLSPGRFAAFDQASIDMPKRGLEMKYAGGGIVHHLGSQMYRGPTVALTELVANGWDADAERVDISIPLDRPLRPEDKVEVSDVGIGMTFDECNDKFLIIGRNRRQAENREYSAGGRLLMAHKGLGKLACFGIANTIEVKTVKDRKLTGFVMSFKDIERLNQGESYHPKVLADGKPTKHRSGTRVILRDISKEITVNKDQFLRSMARRFAVLNGKFRVYVNGKPLKREFGIPQIEFRFPDKVKADVESMVKGIGTTRLSSGTIRWWIGFAKEPIKLKDLQGVSVMTRGKMSQEPWTFDLAGGTTGQHGLQYMIGEITADFLDAGIGKETDHISTNRAGVVWDDPVARPLYEWAQSKIKHLLRAWVEKRAEAQVNAVKKEHPQLVEKVESFPPAERKELNSALRKLAEVPTLGADKLAEVFDYVVDGYTDRVFTVVLEELKDLTPDDRVQVLGLLQTFDILEAIRVHKLVTAHINVIRAFRKMIEAGVPEKPDMHEHIRKYPWLLGTKYQPMEHEISLDKLLQKRFNVVGGRKTGKKRMDFVCFRSGGDVLVIELKRPGEKIGLEELSQIRGYVDYLRNWAQKSTAGGPLGRAVNPEDIKGYLIGHDFVDDPPLLGEIKRMKGDGMFTLKWSDLLMSAEDDHAEYLKVVKARAPKGDPRIKELEEKGLSAE